jgi:hypothetical protein
LKILGAVQVLQFQGLAVQKAVNVGEASEDVALEVRI